MFNICARYWCVLQVPILYQCNPMPVTSTTAARGNSEGSVIYTQRPSLKNLGTRQLKIQELSDMEVNNITTSDFFPFFFFTLILRALFNV